MMRSDLGASFFTSVERLRTTGEALLESVLGTALDGSPIHMLTETAVIKHRVDPTPGSVRIMAISLRQLLVDVAASGRSETAAQAQCDLALEEFTAILMIAARIAPRN